MQNKNGVKMQKKNIEMKSLLRTILEEAKKNKVMFRYNAYELWNWGCSEYIVEWGYDIEQVVKTLQDIDGEGKIEFLQAKYVDKDCKYTYEYNRLVNELDKHWDGYENDNFSEEFFKINKDKISYSLNPKTNTYGITIGEGDIKDICEIHEQEAVEFLLDGDAWLRWELWDTGMDCISDYTTNLNDWIDITKITDEWEKKFKLFEKGLL
mgnify:CR=1 FL=1